MDDLVLNHDTLAVCIGLQQQYFLLNHRLVAVGAKVLRI
jgi:hypothetical protein